MKVRKQLTSENSGAYRKRSKYGNKRCECDGYTFDSQKEYLHYLALRTQGVRALVVHPRFPITISNQHGLTTKVCSVVLDFQYVDDDGRLRYIDVKGKDLPMSKLKRKMVEFQYGIKVELV